MGLLPYLTRRGVPLNRVSFYGKNYATGCPFLIRIMRQGITIDKKIMRQGTFLKDIFGSSLETMDLGKFFMRQVILWAIFYATWYRVWRAFPHSSVTALVKYPPGFFKRELFLDSPGTLYFIPGIQKCMDLVGPNDVNLGLVNG